MIDIGTRSGTVMLRYNEQIQMIEFLNDGHLMVLAPEEAAAIAAQLQKLVHFHGELVPPNYIAYCDGDGKSHTGPFAVRAIQPDWSTWRTIQEAQEWARITKDKEGEVYTHFRLMRVGKDSDVLYGTGVVADEA